MLVAMSGPDVSGNHLTRYLQQLTPQVRVRLLAELERLHELGEDIPHSESLVAALRAEFRNTGQSHYRVGNPSRHFFEPLEPVLVDSAPERANEGQIARGSLGPIWSLVSEQLLRSMAGEYVAAAKAAIGSHNQAEVQRLAAAFRKKAMSYLDSVLKTDDGVATVRAGLDVYTSSHASFGDLTKMLQVMRAQNELAEFARALPAKLVELEGDRLASVFGLLNELRSKRPDSVPFALTIVARRLQTPWQLLRLATKLAASRAVANIAATPYAVVVSMVLDQIDDKRLLLVDAIKHNRIPRAREILTEIHAIDEALRKRIDIERSDWGCRLHRLMTAVDRSMDVEINSIPGDHRHVAHVLEMFRTHKNDHFLRGRLGELSRRSRDVWARVWRAEPTTRPLQ